MFIAGFASVLIGIMGSELSLMITSGVVLVWWLGSLALSRRSNSAMLGVTQIAATAIVPMWIMNHVMNNADLFFRFAN